MTAPAGADADAFAVIAGGGTAGHVNPGLAVAAALVERGHPAWSILWVGSERGLEATMVPAAGHPLHLLPGRGVQRRVALANIAALWGIVVATVRALGIVRRARPGVVVVLGGYASVPCAFAAWVLRVPIVVLEQNARPGLANRLAARVAKVSAVSFEGTALPRAVVTGNPVRREIIGVDRDVAAARKALALPLDRSVVFVTGGSLGASLINDVTLELVSAWRERADVAVRHVVGPRNLEAVRARAPALPLGGLRYDLVGYEERMADAMVAADVVVCRASSGLVSEVAVVGRPSVLIPWSGAAEDHQTANAQVLVAAGAAEVISDADLTAPRLGSALEGLIADVARREQMGTAAAAVARPDAAERVADLVEQQARRPADD
jgi:undecaprenyldiphospho-muramoylpentapeptide beta-N-acetylglucosaminyltransferase